MPADVMHISSGEERKRLISTSSEGIPCICGGNCAGKGRMTRGLKMELGGWWGSKKIVDRRSSIVAGGRRVTERARK
jgi:hypothetical protein